MDFITFPSYILSCMFVAELKHSIYFKHLPRYINVQLGIKTAINEAPDGCDLYLNTMSNI